MSGTTVGEKRVKDIDEIAQKASIVLLDIEGTTTSISFVKDSLFPYIRKNLDQYLSSHWDDAEFQEDLVLLREQATKDVADKVEGGVTIPDGNGNDVKESVLKNINWQMDQDRKTGALKQLQGHIMHEGYHSGVLKGHVYADVVPALKSWIHNGKEVFVYSSGSVNAQKLLFEHTEEGNLLELFSGHFDTEMGAKIEASSYSNIVKKLECKAEEMVFFTDIPKEGKAAQDAGLNVILVARPGNAVLSEEDQVNFAVIKSFHDFVFEVSAKRKKMSVEMSPLKVNFLPNGPSNEPSSQINTSESSNDVEMIDVGGRGDNKQVSEPCDSGLKMPTNCESTVSTENNVKPDSSTLTKSVEMPETCQIECKSEISSADHSLGIGELKNNTKESREEGEVKTEESSMEIESTSAELSTREKTSESLSIGTIKTENSISKTDNTTGELLLSKTVPPPTRDIEIEKSTPVGESKTEESTSAGESKTEELTPAGESKTEELTPAGESKTEELTTAGESKTEELTPAGESKTEELTPAGESKTEELTPAGESKTEELTPAGEIKTEELTPAGEIKTEELTPAGASKTEELTPAGASKTGELTSAGESKTEELTTAGESKTEELTPAGESKTEELTPAGESKTEELTSAGESKTEEFTSAGESKTEEFTSAGESKTEELTSAGESKTEELTSAGESKTEELTSAGESKTGELTSAEESNTGELTSAGESKTEESTLVGEGKAEKSVALAGESKAEELALEGESKAEELALEGESKEEDPALAESKTEELALEGGDKAEEPAALAGGSKVEEPASASKTDQLTEESTPASKSKFVDSTPMDITNKTGEPSLIGDTLSLPGEYKIDESSLETGERMDEEPAEKLDQGSLPVTGEKMDEDSSQVIGEQIDQGSSPEEKMDESSLVEIGNRSEEENKVMDCSPVAGQEKNDDVSVVKGEKSVDGEKQTIQSAVKDKNEKLSFGECATKESETTKATCELEDVKTNGVTNEVKNGKVSDPSENECSKLNSSKSQVHNGDIEETTEHTKNVKVKKLPEDTSSKPIQDTHSVKSVES